MDAKRQNLSNQIVSIQEKNKDDYSPRTKELSPKSLRIDREQIYKEFHFESFSSDSSESPEKRPLNKSLKKQATIFSLKNEKDKFEDDEEAIDSELYQRMIALERQLMAIENRVAGVSTTPPPIAQLQILDQIESQTYHASRYMESEQDDDKNKFFSKNMPAEKESITFHSEKFPDEMTSKNSPSRLKSSPLKQSHQR